MARLRETKFISGFLDLFTKYKFYAQRSIIYYQLINFFIIWVILLRDYSPNWWQYVLVVIGIFVLLWLLGKFDREFKILEREQTLYNDENAEITAIKNNSRIILKQLEDIKNGEGRMVYADRKGKARNRGRSRKSIKRVKKKT